MDEAPLRRGGRMSVEVEGVDSGGAPGPRRALRQE